MTVVAQSPQKVVRELRGVYRTERGWEDENEASTVVFPVEHQGAPADHTQSQVLKTAVSDHGGRGKGSGDCIGD